MNQTSEDWPIIEKRNLGTALREMKRLEEGNDEYYKYNKEKNSPPWKQVEFNEETVELAKSHCPEIILKGLDLRWEKQSRYWGGMMFRVLEEPSKDEDQSVKKRVVQYIYIWTKQRFPLTFWNCALPILILAVLGFYFGMEMTFYKITPVYETELERWFLQHILTDVLNIPTQLTFITLICFWYFVVGIYNIGLSIKQRQIRLRSLFVLYGPVFWLFYVDEVVTGKFFGAESPFYVLNLGFSLNIPQFSIITLRIYWIVTIYVGLVVLVLLIGLIARFPKIRIPLVTHDMDYAPVFIYLEQEKNGNTPNNNAKKNTEWIRTGVLYDRFHYCIGQIPNDALPKERPHFIIDGTWHSMKWTSLEESERLKKRLYVAIFVLILSSFIIGLIPLVGGVPVEVEILLSYLEPIFGIPAIRTFVALIYWFILPIFLILTGYYVVTRYYTSLMDDEYLAGGRHHLTQNKLKILWNLKAKEARLSIRDKLENPSVPSDPRWISFYNTEMEKEKRVDIVCDKTKTKKSNNLNQQQIEE